MLTATEIAARASATPWNRPSKVDALVRQWFTPVAFRTAGGKTVITHVAATAAIWPGEDAQNPDLLAAKEEDARRSLAVYVEQLLEHRTGLPGHRGYFRLTEIVEVP